jgi:adenylate kinase|tara:strand:+ start:125 stop:706 length:582 start_codon:yes stop_codon:yes gene_type:complete
MSIIITGSPGVGKHTIAKEIERTWKISELIDINKIAIDAGLVEQGQDALDVDVNKLKKHLEPIVSDIPRLHWMGRTGLVVGHLAPYVLDGKSFNPCIVLRKNPYKLLDIYKKRGYTEKKMKDNLGSEILGIITNDAIKNFGQEKTFQVDTTDHTPKELAVRIQDIFYGKDNGDNIDWLQLIQEKNDLKKFFDY